MTPLHFVSQNQWGDNSQKQITKTAQVLLEHGASVHMRNKNGQIPLNLASRHGLFGVVELLLKFGADVDAQGNDTMTPLLLVLESRQGDDTETTQLLLEHGASVHMRNKNGQMPLHLASHHRLFNIVALLMKFGADADAQDNDMMTPLLLVSQSPPFGCEYPQITKTVQLLLDHGASVDAQNKSGQMPLHLASHHGLLGIVALLLKFGADVNAQDNDTMTPLHLVSQNQWGDHSQKQITKTAQVLLEHGASVHMQNKYGQMPLHLASQHVLSGIVEVLLKFGADVDARDNNNITPLHFAVSSPFQRGYSKSLVDNSPLLWSVIKTVKLLLGNGANLQMQNDKGETPFQVALRRGEHDILDVLSDYVKNDQAMSL